MSTCMNSRSNFQRILKNGLPKLRQALTTSFGQKYLFYTNVGISVTLSGCGDMLEQHYEMLVENAENQDAKWDRTRTRNMAFYGMAIGAFCHHWYKFLDRRLPGFTLRTVGKKIVVDQFVCSPICIGTLFVVTGLLESKSRGEVWREFQEKAHTLYVAEWVVWPPAQFINFYFLPSRFRVLYDNLVSLGYDVYTSYVKHNDSNESVPDR